MLHLTTSEILSLKLIPNRVLVKTTAHQDTIKTKSGVELVFDKRFSEEMHAPVTGTVVSLPETLIPEIMPWETKMALKVGDALVYSYETAIYCTNPEHGREIRDENNDQYLMIDYEDIFTAKRGGELIPVNGYLLVEPVTEEKLSLIKFPVNKSGRFGRIAVTSPRNERYFAAGKVRTDTYDFNEHLNVGDYVLFSQFSDLTLEYALHNSIDGKKQYFRMQRRDIYHIVDPAKITEVKITLAS